ncbi:chaperonin-like RbcX protein 2, chloroplastic [Musa acuminata AAA Group]|uniref:chaperonin-like RbcX protein 2, chloroplastic n=1 Tax=Musa acuminata AAA Group TaxID=214697 RepID=UPI0031D82933
MAVPMAFGAVAVDPLPSPCLCVDGLNYGRGTACRRPPLPSRPSASSLELSSSFLDARRARRGRIPFVLAKRQQRSRRRGGLVVVVDELGGQYEEGFDDVHVQLINYFTYKASRTVLHQLYEMNPPSYRWFYNFMANNKPTDGKRFLRSLAKEKQDLAERVMITRLHLYGKWIKKCDHAKMYEKISDENLQLMRERLMETVIWPSDDTNMEKID